MRKLLTAAGALAIGAALIYASLGLLLKRGLEAYGPRLLGAPVKVGLVTLSPFTGEGTIRALEVGNPSGYSKATAISVGRVELAVDLKSLNAEKLVIRRLLVERPAVLLEAGSGGTNLQRLQKSLESAAGSAASSSSGPGRKLELKRLSIRGGRVTVLVPALRGGPREVPLPDVELEGLGAGAQGVTAAEASRRVLGAVTDGAIRSAGGLGGLLRQGSGALEKLKGLFKK